MAALYTTPRRDGKLRAPFVVVLVVASVALLLVLLLHVSGEESNRANPKYIPVGRASKLIRHFISWGADERLAVGIPNSEEPRPKPFTTLLIILIGSISVEDEGVVMVFVSFYVEMGMHSRQQTAVVCNMWHINQCCSWSLISFWWCLYVVCDDVVYVLYLLLCVMWADVRSTPL